MRIAILRSLFLLSFAAIPACYVGCGTLGVNEGDKCASPPGAAESMGTIPDGYAEADPEFDEYGEPQPCSVGGEFWKVRVFYGTNRERNRKNSAPNKIYGSELGPLEFGYCDVSIPESHTYGEVERPKLWKFEFKEAPDKHVVLQSVTPLAVDQFGNGLAKSVADSESQEILIFVHGFNVTFAEASYRTAQMYHDLKFDGAPVMYSWPSHGALLNYPSDISHADASEAKFIEFLETVAARSGARQIHLVAHSMGNRLVTQSLQRLGEESAYRQIPKLNEVILAAPDVDAKTFREVIAPEIVKASNRVTIYASSTDRALQASKLLHQGPRLGLGGDDLISFPDNPLIQVIDATGLDLGLITLGHSAYGDELLADINFALDGRDPKLRKLRPHRVRAAWRISASPVPEENGSEVRTASLSEPEVVSKPSFWQRLMFWK